MNATSISLSTILLAASLGGCVLNPSSDQEQADWRDAIVANPTSATGCFHASYPDMTWSQIDCTPAPSRAFATITPTTDAAVPFTVGNGSDYALTVTGKISAASGTFPRVSGLVSENDQGQANTYSIQLNSNFMSGTEACAGATGSNCLSWAQYVYSSSEQSAFLQNWLIFYGDTCPSSDWNSDGQGDCFINSNAASAPTLPLANDTDLSQMKMSGKAVNGGNDTLVFASGTDAFTTSEADSITNLASAWNSAEFNIIGDGGGTEAVFNKSTAIEVRIGVKDGSTAAPTCSANDGTTGETNNRILGACSAFSGAEPAIEFKETGS
jgi:hypothetical protein